MFSDGTLFDDELNDAESDCEDEEEEAEEEEELSDEEIEEEIDQFFANASDDFSELDEFLSEHEGEYGGDIAEYAFREAIRSGNYQYVEEHADDFDLNDSDGASSFIEETDDDEMKTLLMDHGAFKSYDDYSECRYAMETVNGNILAFDPDFQRAVYEKYKEITGLTEERIREIIADGGYDEELDREVESEMGEIGVIITESGVEFEDREYENGYDLNDLLEDLGYELSFEGDSWKLETVGVYFIK